MTESKPRPSDDDAVEAESTAFAQEAEPVEDASAAVETLAGTEDTEDPEELRAELDRLRAENEKLSSAATPHTFWRNSGAGVLIVIGVLLFSISIAALWLNRTVMDENRWVETMAPLAQDVAIQDYVANSASNAIFSAIDIQTYVDQALASLPAPAKILSAPITGAIQNFVKDAAFKFVRSPQFPELWNKMNRIAHKAFIASITQTSGQVINNQNGKIILDTSVLSTEIKKVLSDRGLTFVNNINLPVAKQQIVLYDSPALAQFGVLIRWMNTMAYVLPILTLLLLGGGVAVAANRRKAVLWMGIGIVVVTVLPLQAIYFGQIPFANAVYNLAQVPTAAAQNAYNIVFRNFVQAEKIAAVFGLVFVIGAILAGPSSWAVALRRGLQKGLNNVGPDWDFGPVGEWIYAHASGVRTTGIVIAVLALLVSPAKSIAMILWYAFAVVVWLLLVGLFGRPRPTTASVDAGEDTGSDPEEPQAA
jgi:hypothetical protein